jgi:hypothetical protein
LGGGNTPGNTTEIRRFVIECTPHSRLIYNIKNSMFSENKLSMVRIVGRRSWMACIRFPVAIRDLFFSTQPVIQWVLRGLSLGG